MSASNAASHVKMLVRSYKNLDNARQAAATNNTYNSPDTRKRLTELFRARFGGDLHDWQLDVTEAILLGLDTILIAGTGSGKTMPFMMPLLLDDKKKVLVLSPLKILQEEQVSIHSNFRSEQALTLLQAQRFQAMGISATAVNGDTWDSGLLKVCPIFLYSDVKLTKVFQDLHDGCYRGILTSPEMCLENVVFRDFLASTNFRDICAIVVDEAHCIVQWGEDFHTAFREIGKLRAFFPAHIPILATSATLTDSALREVRTQLSIDMDDSFFLNLGNDCPNVLYSVLTLDSSTDFAALKTLLLPSGQDPEKPEDIKKTLVFLNKVQASQLGVREIRSWFPPHLRNCIDYLYAIRTPTSKRRAMRNFCNGSTRILIATEAAGMVRSFP